MLFEQSRLSKKHLANVAPGFEISPGELENLSKTAVPDIRRIVDRLILAIRAYASFRGASSELIKTANNRYNEAVLWISWVESRILQIQLLADATQSTASKAVRRLSTTRCETPGLNVAAGDPTGRTLCTLTRFATERVKELVEMFNHAPVGQRSDKIIRATWQRIGNFQREMSTTMEGPAVTLCMRELSAARRSLTQILIHIDKKEASVLDPDCSCPQGTCDRNCYLPGIKQRVEAWVSEVAAATAEVPASPELPQPDLIIAHDRASTVVASDCSVSRPVETVMTVADTGGVNTPALVKGDEAASAALTIQVKEADGSKEAMEYRERGAIPKRPKVRDKPIQAVEGLRQLPGPNLETATPSGEQGSTSADLTKIMLERQLSFDQGLLTEERMPDVASGSTLRPGELALLLKFRVPWARRITNRLRQGVKAYTKVRGADYQRLIAAQDSYEKTCDWITAVEQRGYHESTNGFNVGFRSPTLDDCSESTASTDVPYEDDQQEQPEAGAAAVVDEPNQQRVSVQVASSLAEHHPVEHSTSEDKGTVGRKHDPTVRATATSETVTITCCHLPTNCENPANCPGMPIREQIRLLKNQLNDHKKVVRQMGVIVLKLVTHLKRRSTTRPSEIVDHLTEISEDSEGSDEEWRRLWVEKYGPIDDSPLEGENIVDGKGDHAVVQNQDQGAQFNQCEERAINYGPFRIVNVEPATSGRPPAPSVSIPPVLANSLQSTINRPPTFHKGPRWTCPLKGHAGHDLQVCREFWGAASCEERRRKLKKSGCICCLGKDQGCAKGACVMMAEVPRDIICMECAFHQNRGPPNFLTCTFPRHKKPSRMNVVDIAEKWIPKLSIASLGVDLSLTHQGGLPKPTPKSKGTGAQKSGPKKRTTSALVSGTNACAHCAHGAPQLV